MADSKDNIKITCVTNLRTLIMILSLLVWILKLTQLQQIRNGSDQTVTQKIDPNTSPIAPFSSTK